MKVKDLLFNNYNIVVRKIAKLSGGFRNQCFKVDTDSSIYVLVIFKNEKGIENKIKNAHYIEKYLKSKNFPTRVPIVSKRGVVISKELFRGENCYFALYNYLNGSTIPWEAYTRRHLKSIGKTLSDMHFELKALVKKKKDINLTDWYEDTSEDIESMKEYFKEVESWIERKLKLKLNWKKLEYLFQKLIKIDYRNTNILHYDFVRGNILFSEKLDNVLYIYPITGILDFEKVCLGPEIADIARTLAFLIVDCKYKSEKIIRKRFLISGYAKRGKNSLAFSDINNDRNLNRLVKYFLIRDFWKFLESNPYEFLHMNEHYKRTRNILVTLNVLTTV